MPVLFLILGIGAIAVLAGSRASEKSKDEEPPKDGEKPPATGYTMTLAAPEPSSSSTEPLSRRGSSGKSYDFR
jgi:hypothetical protein